MKHTIASIALLAVLSGCNVMPTTIGVDGRHTGSISAGDVDRFMVNVAESGTLIAYTTGSLDTYGRLYDSAGNQLVSNDDGGEGSNFRVERIVEEKTYYVSVEAFNNRAAGSYTLHTEFELPTKIALGGQQTGTIDPAGDVDYFRVNLTEPGTLKIHTTGGTDTYGRLYDSAGNQISRFWYGYDDDYEGCNFRIEFATSRDVVIVSVRGYAGAVGNYTIHADFEPTTPTE